jgi:hypothetical protein
MKSTFTVTITLVKKVDIEDVCQHDDDEGTSIQRPNCGKEACRENLMNQAGDYVLASGAIHRVLSLRGITSEIRVDEF